MTYNNSTVAWVSVSNGIFICMQCAGKYRGLGVAKSFVKSITLDSWSNREVELMRKGGNQRLRDFFAEYHIKTEFPLTMRFSFLALYYYKLMLAAEVDGTPAPPKPSLEDGWKHYDNPNDVPKLYSPYQ